MKLCKVIYLVLPWLILGATEITARGETAPRRPTGNGWTGGSFFGFGNYMNGQDFEDFFNGSGGSLGNGGLDMGEWGQGYSGTGGGSSSGDWTPPSPPACGCPSGRCIEIDPKRCRERKPNFCRQTCLCTAATNAKKGSVFTGKCVRSRENFDYIEGTCLNPEEKCNGIVP